MTAARDPMTLPGVRGDRLVDRMARSTAGELRRAVRRRDPVDQRLAVVRLVHQDPELLVETVLQLARAAPDYTAADAAQALDADEEVAARAVVQG